MARALDATINTLAALTPARTTFICDILAPTPRKFTNDPRGLTIGSVVGALNLTAGGSGFTSTPLVTFTGGGGQGALAIAVVSGGAVTALVLISRGYGYTSNPTVGFSGGGGTGATATATIGTTFSYAPVSFTPAIESPDGATAVLGSLAFVNTDNAWTDLWSNSANIAAPVAIQRVWRDANDAVAGSEIWLEGYTGKPSFAGETLTIACHADVGRLGSSPAAEWSEVMTSHQVPSQGAKITFVS